MHVRLSLSRPGRFLAIVAVVCALRAAPLHAGTLDVAEASTPRDGSGEPAGTVPAWQLTSITFALVPVPATLLLITVGLGSVAAPGVTGRPERP
jgi:hypothetical protein